MRPMARRPHGRSARAPDWRGIATIVSVALVVLAFAAFAAEALAQSTGGSFGGGSWGGGGGGGGGGSYGGGYDDGGGGGSASGLIGLVFLAFRINPIFGLVVLGFVVVVVIAGGAARGGLSGGGARAPWNGPSVVHAPQVLSAAPSASARAWMNADVTKVRIALELSARGPVESELGALWSTTNVGMKGGLVRVVQRTTQLLRSQEAAWRYAGESNFHPMSPPQAESIFRQLSDTARSKRAVSITPSREPTSLFLVTVIVAARREIVDFHAHRPEQLRMILDDLARLSVEDLVAAEISWLPLDAGAGMSAAELGRLYPDMRAVEHASPGGAAHAIAASTAAHAHGRIYCPWCGKDYARQHPRCVHCGGPRPEGT